MGESPLNIHIFVSLSIYQACKHEKSVKVSDPVKLESSVVCEIAFP